MITHLEPDILECKVKWDLGSITTNKASEGDGISAELLQILKDDAVKELTQYASKFENLSSGHRTGKGQFSIQSQRKVKVKSLSRVQLFGTPWTVAYQAPLSMGFSRQEW